jgi:hypothetical protein
LIAEAGLTSLSVKCATSIELKKFLEKKGKKDKNSAHGHTHTTIETKGLRKIPLNRFKSSVAAEPKPAKGSAGLFSQKNDKKV